MRSPAIPLAILTIVVVGCADNSPTAPSPQRAVPISGSADREITLTFDGTLDAATHTSSFDPQTNTFHIHLTGTGTARYLGRFTLVTDIVLAADAILGAEHLTLTAANGDALLAAGTASATPAPDGTLTSEEKLTITGGTGRFAAAKGEFTLRQVNLAEDRVSNGSFDGTIIFSR